MAYFLKGRRSLFNAANFVEVGVIGYPNEVTNVGNSGANKSFSSTPEVWLSLLEF